MLVRLLLGFGFLSIVGCAGRQWNSFTTFPLQLDPSYRETHLGPLLEAHELRDAFKDVSDGQVRLRNLDRLTAIVGSDLAARERFVRKATSRAQALLDAGDAGEDPEKRDARNRQALGILWDAAWAAGGVDPVLGELMTRARSLTDLGVFQVGHAPVFHLAHDREYRHLILGVGPALNYYTSYSTLGSTLIWSLSEGRIEKHLEFSGEPVHPLAVSGDFLISFGSGKYRLLNWTTGGILWERAFPPGENGYVVPSGCFDREGRRFAISLGAGGVAVLDRDRLQEIFRVESPTALSPVFLSPKGEWLLAGQRLTGFPSAYLLPVREQGKALVGEPGIDEPTAYTVQFNDARGIGFHPEGGCYAVGRYGVRIVGLSEGMPLLEAIGRGLDPSVPEFRDPEGVVAVAFSPDGNWLASVDVEYRKPWDLDRRASLLRIWNLRDWSLHACFEAGDKASSLCWGPDSKRVWIGLESGGLRRILVDWDGAMSSAVESWRSANPEQRGSWLELPRRMREVKRDELRLRAMQREIIDAELAAAIEQLAKPIERRTSPRGLFDTYGAFYDDIHEQDVRAIELLRSAPASVEPWLVNLALSGAEVSARHLAMHLLALRGDPAAIGLVEIACASADPRERYLGVRVFEAAADAGKPLPVAGVLPLLTWEWVSRTKGRLAMALGKLRSVEAVPALRKAVRVDPRFTGGVWALGLIGSGEATSDVIRSFLMGEHNRHIAIDALGGLPTPEAVDFLIQHLHAYLAPEALAATRSERALPALRKHLEVLRSAGGEDIDLSATVVSVIRLVHEDPREALLAVFQDERERLKVRHHALWNVSGQKVDGFERRILDIYRTSPDPEAKRYCFWMLTESSFPGVTEAMIDHALGQLEGGKSGWSTSEQLREVLNRRLGTDFENFGALRAGLRARANPR